jgi:hypothetical protein
MVLKAKSWPTCFSSTVSILESKSETASSGLSGSVDAVTPFRDAPFSSGHHGSVATARVNPVVRLRRFSLRLTRTSSGPTCSGVKARAFAGDSIQYLSRRTQTLAENLKKELDRAIQVSRRP